MKIKSCLIIQAALITIFVLWFAITSGCGSQLEKAASNMVPDVTIVNFIPGSDSVEECEDCPGAINIIKLYAYEIDADTWGLGAQIYGGCIDPIFIDYAEAGFWIRDDNGIWRQLLVASLNNPAECLNDIMAWYPILKPCIGETWCSEADPWISLTIKNRTGFIAQAFVQPGGQLPGF